MKKIYFLLAVLFLTACTTNSPSIEGFTHQSFIGSKTTLTGEAKNIKAGHKLRVYIDGRASTTGLFTKRTSLKYPVAAQLAQKDKSPSILYLNRTCYFSNDEKCTPATWEEGRYLPEIIDEMKYALLRIKEKYAITELEFIGYDDGAAIALLLATRLNSQIPVSKVVTVAGVINTAQYALLTDETLHTDSLNPATETFSLSNIPQVHLVGGKDKQIPLSITKNYAKSIPNPVLMQIKSYPSADHFNWAQFKMDY